MTMTKAQKAKKKTEDRAKRARTVLLYALTLFCALSMWNSYQLANDVAVNEAAIIVLIEQQLEADAKYISRAEVIELLQQLNEIDAAQAAQIEAIIAKIRADNAPPPLRPPLPSV